VKIQVDKLERATTVCCKITLIYYSKDQVCISVDTLFFKAFAKMVAATSGIFATTLAPVFGAILSNIM